MSTSKTIGDYLYRAMLFLGIFAVASSGGDNKYTFEIGDNLMMTIISVVLIFAILKMVEIKLKLEDVAK